MQKRWVKIAIAAAAVVILVVLLVPLFINADTFRPKIEDELSRSLGRNVSFDHLSFSLITSSLVASNLSVADDPALSSAPFLQAKELHIGVALGQFLLHRSVQITDLTVDSPSIHLIHEQNGTWNFSSMGSASATPSSQQSAAVPALIADSIKIKNGSATVSTIPQDGNPFACTEINLTVQHFAFTQPFPFDLSVKMPGDGSLKLSGTAGPISLENTARTPFQATLEIKHFDPIAANVIAPEDGVSMLADFNAKIASDSTNLTSTGTINASRLVLARSGSPAPQPVQIDYTISDNLAERSGQVSDLAIHTGPVAVHIGGSYRFAEPTFSLDLHLSAPNLPVDQLEQLLPAAGVHLPSGSQLKGGTLTANLAITGPANAITIAGPVEIDNSQLAGFNLGSKIQGINPLGGASNGTQIQKLSTDLNSTPQSTQFSNIYANVPQIGTASGSGNVAPSGALDFQLVAKFNGSTAAGALANGGLNAIGSLLGNHSNTADNGIPLTITGTTSNPSIRANLGAMVKQQLGNSPGQKNSNPVKTLKGLFGK